MSAVLGVHHVQIYTDDLKKSIAFYQALGGSVSMYDEIQLPNELVHMAMVSLGETNIELSERRGYSPLPGQTFQAIGHVCLLVEGLDEYTERLRLLGYKFESEGVISQTVWGGFRSIFIKGPSAEKIELREA